MENKNLIDTKKYWDVKDENMKGRIEPVEITMLLTSEEYGKKLGNICTLDYYIVGLGFETRMTKYGIKRAKICAGGYNGCSGPAMIMNDFGEALCASCIKELRKEISNQNKKEL